MALIEPHGGKLVNRIVDESTKTKLLEQAKSLPRIALGDREQCDLEMIAIGAFSPLEGFVTEEDVKAVFPALKVALPQAGFRK